MKWYYELEWIDWKFLRSQNAYVGSWICGDIQIDVMISAVTPFETVLEMKEQGKRELQRRLDYLDAHQVI
jgi:hypothetical protein